MAQLHVVKIFSPFSLWGIDSMESPVPMHALEERERVQLRRHKHVEARIRITGKVCESHR